MRLRTRSEGVYPTLVGAGSDPTFVGIASYRGSALLTTASWSPTIPCWTVRPHDAVKHFAKSQEHAEA
jgi:hypothetical protein